VLGYYIDNITLMKKLLYLPLLFLAINVSAQSKILFKIKYLPGKIYAGTTTLALTGHATVSGNDTVLKKLQSQGITQPIALNMSMKMEGNTQTGQKVADGSFPLTVGYKVDELAVTVNGKAIPIPADKMGKSMSIYGHADADGQLKADSVGGSKMKDTSQAHIAQMMNMIQKNIKFPDKPMRIGETFTQDTPIDLPIAGSNISASSKVVYTLVSINEGNANFDMTMSMDMSVPVHGSTIHITGSGSGKMVYNVKNSFPTTYTTSINMMISGNITNLQINATMNMDMAYNYIIN
jgi:hypothetical protein